MAGIGHPVYLLEDKNAKPVLHEKSPAPKADQGQRQGFA
jgi:hypothetical protein